MHSLSICAVIVLHFPDIGFRNRLHRIIKQVDAIVIVDNSGVDAETRDLPDEFAGQQVHFLWNDSNRGVATALNQGVQFAEQYGYQWAILFYNDTEPKERMSSVLLDLYQDCCKNDEIALVGSNYINGLGNIQVSCDDSITSWIPRKTIITSGTLLSLEVYNLIGPFRDEFFIDAVDHDYCLRAASKGIKVVLSCEPLMHHAIGMQSRHSLAWKKTASSNHSAVRRYYMARNNLILVREYCLKEPAWAWKSVCYIGKTFILVAFFEKDKVPKLIAMISGILHAVIGRIENVQD